MLALPQNMVRRLLTVDPKKRLTARQAVGHPWLATSGDILSANDLSFNRPKFHSANAKRKLRSAIDMVRNDETGWYETPRCNIRDV